MIIFLLFIIGFEAETPRHYDTFEIRHFYKDYYIYKGERYGYSGVWVYENSVITYRKDGKPIKKYLYHHYEGLTASQQYEFIAIFDTIVKMNDIKVKEYPNPLVKTDNRIIPVKQGKHYISYFRESNWELGGFPRHFYTYVKSTADVVTEEHIMDDSWSYFYE